MYGIRFCKEDVKPNVHGQIGYLISQPAFHAYRVANATDVRNKNYEPDAITAYLMSYKRDRTTGPHAALRDIINDYWHTSVEAFEDMEGNLYVGLREKPLWKYSDADITAFHKKDGQQWVHTYILHFARYMLEPSVPFGTWGIRPVTEPGREGGS